jgi:two-component sensor histidine kinase
MATNSAKHGALSVSSGTLDLSCNANEDEVAVKWTERGVPIPKNTNKREHK